MQDYYHKAYGCPYYMRNKETTLVCEAGQINFKTKKAMREFHLICIDGWKECPLFKALTTDYYEYEREINENNSERRGTVLSRNPR